jgi:hypothetical protein
MVHWNQAQILYFCDVLKYLVYISRIRIMHNYINNWQQSIKKQLLQIYLNNNRILEVSRINTAARKRGLLNY